VNIGFAGAGGPGDGAREGTTSGLAAVGFGLGGAALPASGLPGLSAGLSASGCSGDFAPGGCGSEGRDEPDAGECGGALAGAGGAGLDLAWGFAGGSLGSLTVPFAGADPAPSGAVTVPADADERGEADGPEGSSRLSFGTRCTPDADGDM
jgi:hypothetical protein